MVDTTAVLNISIEGKYNLKEKKLEPF